VNQNVLDWEGYTFAIDHGMGIITGTDMHTPMRGVNGWTTLISNFSEDAIFAALKAKNTSIIYNAIDSPYGATPSFSTKENIYDFLLKIGDFFNGYYTYRTGMYSFNSDISFCSPTVFELHWSEIWGTVIWLAIAFVGFEILRQILEFLVIPRIRKLKCRKRTRLHGDDDLETKALIEYELEQAEKNRLWF